MIAQRSICQNDHPCHSCNTRTLREHQVLQVIFFTSLCPLIDLCWRVIRKLEQQEPLLQMTHKSFRYLFHQAPSHDVSLVSGPPYELALSQDALPRRLLDFANCLPRIKQGRCIRITQAPEDIFDVLVFLTNLQLTSSFLTS